MKKILFFTHNPYRDSLSDNLVNNALREAGHEVWSRGYLQNDKQMITCIKPDVVVLPEIRCEYTLDLAKQLKAWGCKVVVKMCEVGITRESIPHISLEYQKAIFGNFPFTDHIDLMLGWGPEMCRLQIGYANVPEVKIAPVGGLQFDQYFLSPPPPQFTMPNYKPNVLFATGFAYAERNKEYAMPEAMPGDKIHAEMVNKDIKGRSLWFNSIKKFHERFGQFWNILVKPHAGERAYSYEKILDGIATVIPPMSGFQALQISTAVVHSGSTMAYEAHLMGRPAFNFGNVCEDVVVSQISPNSSTIDELISQFSTANFTRSNANPAVIKNLEDEYYGPVDGKAHIRAAEAISALPEPKTNIPDIYPVNTEVKYMTDGIILSVSQWTCASCGQSFFSQMHREMIKCPYCGIACTRISQRPAVQGE